MKVPSQYPDAQDFVSAIAKPFDSDPGSKVVAPFGIVWSDAIKLDSGLETYNISATALGLSFTFKDAGLVFEKEHHDVGDGPFLMTNCGFWGYEDEYESYKGPLWKDLRFSDTVADAVAKLGAPTRVGRLDIHFWELPDFRLTIQWKSPGKIRVISYWMKQD
ncbi:hypothetical protein QMO14_17345 [Variovorax sp. CAN2819]|uniref:hypothetical protein n=1 Tax=Variovorax sp. CAN15 TaxID=3046727 RepID=UPI0026480BDE|nr:hypothetical protein [Variovorax sp. CAN15]MDN6885369.1 hypothetical protein [Variovorax sp. CAN15]